MGLRGGRHLGGTSVEATKGGGKVFHYFAERTCKGEKLQLLRVHFYKFKGYGRGRGALPSKKGFEVFSESPFKELRIIKEAPTTVSY